MTTADLLTDTPFQGYSYAYPHKTAYRPLRPPAALRDVWESERQNALFLYIHVPFCEMRCGFCNLFTQAKPGKDIVADYLGALRRQAIRVRSAVPEGRFARCAVGGGTPTFLDTAGLEKLFAIAENVMGAKLADIPVSVEVSPETIDAEKLALLRARGVKRVSIGVQSFVETETAAVGRPQKAKTLQRSLELLQQARFPSFNIDLIYGLPGQTVASWLETVNAALQFAPTELYLYPLYVRALTGLGRAEKEWADVRTTCYREAVALLASRGFTQLSMRMFQAAHAPPEEGPVYCCQDDGMIGLGPGARSYTRTLHYSSEYAVGVRGVREIIGDYVSRSEEAFDWADYGFHLNEDEQRRRFVIQSLLTRAGLSLEAYRNSFHSEVVDDLSLLVELESLGLAARMNGTLRLTATGVERSDAIGPWLYSNRVRGLMEEYAWR